MIFVIVESYGVLLFGIVDKARASASTLVEDLLESIRLLLGFPK